jgi:hypothetical protein
VTSDPSPTIGEHYRASRERLTVMLAGASQADWARPVPACPGWEVHDVVAHRLMIEEFSGDATIVADLDGDVARSQPGTGTEHHLRTTPFEVFRFRLGRRTRQQVADLEWTPVPDDALLDSLFIFGPAAAPLVEEA